MHNNESEILKVEKPDGIRASGEPVRETYQKTEIM